jgi:hypothetical protein
MPGRSHKSKNKEWALRARRDVGRTMDMTLAPIRHRLQTHLEIHSPTEPCDWLFQAIVKLNIDHTPTTTEELEALIALCGLVDTYKGKQRQDIGKTLQRFVVMMAMEFAAEPDRKDDLLWLLPLGMQWASSDTRRSDLASQRAASGFMVLGYILSCHDLPHVWPLIRTTLLDATARRPHRIAAFELLKEASHGDASALPEDVLAAVETVMKTSRVEHDVREACYTLVDLGEADPMDLMFELDRLEQEIASNES